MFMTDRTRGEIQPTTGASHGADLEHDEYVGLKLFRVVWKLGAHVGHEAASPGEVRRQVEGSGIGAGFDPPQVPSSTLPSSS